MTLKKAVKNNDSEMIKVLTEEISTIETNIATLVELKKQRENQLLELLIKPFKIGGYALVEIPSGRTRKWQTCSLEAENGILYARPIKDGILSGRHFSVIPINKSYSELLKEVEE